MFEKIRKSQGVSNIKNSDGEFIVFQCVPDVHRPVIKSGEEKVNLEFARFQEYGKSKGGVSIISIDDSPLTQEEKKRYYKSHQNVMGSKKIRELMDAHSVQNQKTQKGGKSGLKMTLILTGIALSLQIIAVLLIFI